jgi:hypothetical protein
MQTLTTETFESFIATGDKVVMLSKPGCSNCVAVRPRVATLEVTHPGIEVGEYETANGDDAVYKQYPCRMFPHVLYFRDGVKVHSVEGNSDDTALALPLAPDIALKAVAYDCIRAIEQADHARKQLAFINSILNSRAQTVSKSHKSPDTQTGVPFVDPAEDLQCDSCQ